MIKETDGEDAMDLFALGCAEQESTWTTIVQDMHWEAKNACEPSKVQQTSAIPQQI